MVALVQVAAAQIIATETSTTTVIVVFEGSRTENVSDYIVEEPADNNATTAITTTTVTSGVSTTEDNRDNASAVNETGLNENANVTDDTLYLIDEPATNVTDNNATTATTTTTVTSSVTTTEEELPLTTTLSGASRIVMGTLLLSVNNASIFQTHKEQVQAALSTGFAKALSISTDIVTMELLDRRRLGAQNGPRYYGRRRLEAGSVPVSFTITNPPSHVPDTAEEIVSNQGDAIIGHVNDALQQALAGSGLTLTVTHVVSAGSVTSVGTTRNLDKDLTTAAPPDAGGMDIMGLVTDYLPFVIFCGVCVLCFIGFCCCGILRCCCKRGGCCVRCCAGKPRSVGLKLDDASEDDAADDENTSEVISPHHVVFDYDEEATPVTVSPFSSPVRDDDDRLARARGRESTKRSRRSQSSSSDNSDDNKQYDDGSTSHFSTPAHGNAELTPFKDAFPAGEVAAWVRNVYTRYNPSKLSRVDALLTEYRGREEDLILKVQRKYRLGPEAVTNIALPACGVCSPVGPESISLIINDCGLTPRQEKE